MSDIDLSAVSTEDLFHVLTHRLVNADLKEEDRNDRWKSPEQIDVVHAVLKLLAKPRLASDGGWPVVPYERFEEFANVVGLLRQATMEPDPDGAHVIRIHYEDRSEGYLAAEPFAVPHRLLTIDDIKTAQRAIAMLGSSVDRISSAVATAFGYHIRGVELTDRGRMALAAREEKSGE
ncbi:hypothetical protein HFN89_01095 [Rhizobium laguerreae]|nr:hypothetical protein [Rhizobium laguerreae]